MHRCVYVQMNLHIYMYIYVYIQYIYMCTYTYMSDAYEYVYVYGKTSKLDLAKDTSDGTYSHVESEDMIAEAFGEALGGLLSTTHQSHRLQLEMSIDFLEGLRFWMIRG